MARTSTSGGRTTIFAGSGLDKVTFALWRHVFGGRGVWGIGMVSTVGWQFAANGWTWGRENRHDSCARGQELLLDPSHSCCPSQEITFGLPLKSSGVGEVGRQRRGIQRQGLLRDHLGPASAGAAVLPRLEPDQGGASALATTVHRTEAIPSWLEHGEGRGAECPPRAGGAGDDYEMGHGVQPPRRQHCRRSEHHHVERGDRRRGT